MFLQRSRRRCPEKSVRTDPLQHLELLEVELVTLVRFIAARLRELRKKHELTQEQVAALLGTDLKWYQRVEWCEKDVRASTVDRLAAAFGVPTLDFLGGEIPDSKVSKRIPKAPHRPRQEGRIGSKRACKPKPRGNG